MSTTFRPDLLHGKVALVTGGGSGICKGIAAAFVAHGASVGIVGRKVERLEAAAAELSARGPGRAWALPGDVRDYATVEGIVDGLLERAGELHIVVNGAAGNFLCPAAQLSSNGFRTVLDIDALGTFNVSRAAFERALGQAGGSIINISATLHYGATMLQVHAAAAKAAVDATTRGMALEWGPAGVRVNGIAPGPIDDTEGVARLLPADQRERALRSIPLRRFGLIEEIADVALFLASDAASLITGTVIVADGGACLPQGMNLDSMG
ncbi:SDR family oxidoreductase [Paraliomyxa miuraensis]|uniref:SDR family oxidoreductase n=1 Tax=Paraliomyxa miuraensis TaxID=376150 RepID=UPI0022506F08|nr:SDR family oxidoreductase [Paraliomyxa miuraensis]MCX4241532.1 SDR family oxidoreductase [Paraliomyxa miuraensis]